MLAEALVLRQSHSIRIIRKQPLNACVRQISANLQTLYVMAGHRCRRVREDIEREPGDQS